MAGLATYLRAGAAHTAVQWARAKEKVLPKVEAWRRGRPNAKWNVVMAKLVDLIPR